MHRLLNKEGVLFGLLFDMDKNDGPPYGGNADEYVGLFQNKFELNVLQKCLESIAPRLGRELIFEFKKK
jgi:methyl halide transferase